MGRKPKVDVSMNGDGKKRKPQTLDELLALNKSFKFRAKGAEDFDALERVFKTRNIKSLKTAIRAKFGMPASAQETKIADLDTTDKLLAVFSPEQIRMLEKQGLKVPRKFKGR